MARRPDPHQPTLPLATQASAAGRSHCGRPLRTVGLFAGIGGLELGLRRAGHPTNLLCELEPGAAAVLRQRFPGTPLHDDVCTLEALPESTDLLVGGFPCQDLSQAGKTVGIEGARSGLIGEVFRLVERHRTPWVLLENVPFMLQLARGRAMDVIVSAFEHLGYAWAYRVVDSRAFAVPQRRERVYFLATLEGDPRDVLFADDAGEPTPRRHGWDRAHGFYWTEGIRGLGWADDAVPTLKGGSTIGIPSPPAVVLASGDVVTPHIHDAERLQGFEAGWTSPAEQVTRAGHRWKLVGNAVTVGAAAWIGGRLREPSERGRAGLGWGLTPGAAWPTAAWNVGHGRFGAQVSPWPHRPEMPPLEVFLEHQTKPLSVRATAGFLERASRGSLRFPEGFLERVRAHLRSMEQTRGALAASA